MKLKHKIVHLFLAMMMTLSLIPSFSSPVIAAANENLALGQTATASAPILTGPGHQTRL